MARSDNHRILIEVVKGTVLPGFFMAWFVWYFSSDKDYFGTAVAISVAIFVIALISRWFVEKGRQDTPD